MLVTGVLVPGTLVAGVHMALSRIMSYEIKSLWKMSMCTVHNTYTLAQTRHPRTHHHPDSYQVVKSYQVQLNMTYMQVTQSRWKWGACTPSSMPHLKIASATGTAMAIFVAYGFILHNKCTKLNQDFKFKH